MTILSPATSPPQHGGLLTDFDVMDLCEAIRNATRWNATALNPRDKQALALATYWNGFDSIDRTLCASIVEGDLVMPIDDRASDRLFGMHDRMQEVDEDVQSAWLAAHDAAALRRVADGKAWDEDMWIVHAWADPYGTRDLTDVERAAMQDIAWDGVLGRCQAAVLWQLADRLIAEAPALTLLAGRDSEATE